MTAYGFFGRFGDGFVSVIRYISDVIERDRIREEVHKERMALKQMDEDQLRDIGLSNFDILKETQKSYYDIPIERIPKRLRSKKIQCTSKHCKS